MKIISQKSTKLTKLVSLRSLGFLLLILGSSVTLVAATPRAKSSVTPGTQAMIVVPQALPGGFTLTLSTNLPVKIYTTSALGQKMVFLMGATNYTVQIPNEGAEKYFTTGVDVPLTWTPPANNPSPVTGYNIYYGPTAWNYIVDRVPVGLTNACSMNVNYPYREMHINITPSYADGTEGDFALAEVVVQVPAVVSLTRNP